MTVVGQLNTDMVIGLKDMMGEDFEQLVVTFRQDSRYRIANIESGLASKTAELVRANAHSFKGSSANMGATLLSDYCHQLELSASAGDLITASRQLQNIKTEFDQVAELLVTL